MQAADAREAVSVILEEAAGEKGIVVVIRSGGDPGRERMRRLIASLAVVRGALQGQASLARPVANALFVLAFYLQAALATGSSGSAEWSRELVNDEQYQVYEIITNIFEDPR